MSDKDKKPTVKAQVDEIRKELDELIGFDAEPIEKVVETDPVLPVKNEDYVPLPSFPELKNKAYEEYEYWEPDMVIIEAKATGTPLIDELRLRGIPALGFSPGKGKDKITRMHMVAPLFEAGVVWAPEDKKFADEVIEEVVSFPNGDYDDFCDSMTLALMRFRQGGFVSLDGEDDEEDTYRPKREYY